MAERRDIKEEFIECLTRSNEQIWWINFTLSNLMWILSKIYSEVSINIRRNRTKASKNWSQFLWQVAHIGMMSRKIVHLRVCLNIKSQKKVTTWTAITRWCGNVTCGTRYEKCSRKSYRQHWWRPLNIGLVFETEQMGNKFSTHPALSLAPSV